MVYYYNTTERFCFLNIKEHIFYHVFTTFYATEVSVLFGVYVVDDGSAVYIEQTHIGICETRFKLYFFIGFSVLLFFSYHKNNNRFYVDTGIATAWVRIDYWYLRFSNGEKIHLYFMRNPPKQHRNVQQCIYIVVAASVVKYFLRKRSRDISRKRRIVKQKVGAPKFI